MPKQLETPTVSTSTVPGTMVASAPVETQANAAPMDAFGTPREGDAPILDINDTGVPARKAPEAVTPEGQAEPIESEGNAPGMAESEQEPTPEVQEPQPDPAQPIQATDDTEINLTIGPKSFKTIGDIKKVYNESATEAIKLNNHKKELEEQLDFAMDKLAEYEDKVADMPPFKLLTADEYEILPRLEQDQYMYQFNDWKRNSEKAKGERAEFRAQVKAERGKLTEYRKEREEKLSQDFPDYKTLEPLRLDILQRNPGLENMRHGVDLVYLAAVGMAKLDAERQAKNIVANKNNATAAGEAGKAAQSGMPKGQAHPNSGAKIINIPELGIINKPLSRLTPSERQNVAMWEEAKDFQPN
jgi:hypothetical protein